ncbi:hypothetical protein COW46_03750 [Candidatus Gracilibacteria bacterium CG17_big_fil_post_rev_8_21_14_2_50_48_13]|nr:MAG: hypothetical protein COW46_03750 [Candidatus Gracilibacteria bacterium CG17_big_fil_post_rev_8_21_14_2_50_48_13]
MARISHNAYEAEVPASNALMQYSVPLFQGDHDKFQALFAMVENKTHTLPDLVDILCKHVGKNQAKMLQNDVILYRLSRVVESAGRILGEEKILAFLILFLDQGIAEAIKNNDEDRFMRLSYMAEVVVEQLVHEAKTNVLSREEYVTQILRRRIFQTTSPASFDLIAHMLPSEDAHVDLAEVYHKKLCQGLEGVMNSPSVSKAVLQIIEDGLGKQVKEEILPFVQWPAGRKTPISVFDHLLAIVQEGIESLGISYHPILGDAENAAKTMWGDARVRSLFAYLSPLIYATVEHRVEKQNTYHQRKNLFILYGTSMQFVRKILAATEVQKNAFPEVYIRVGYEPEAYEEPCHTNRLLFDAWNPEESRTNYPTLSTPQLLDDALPHEQILSDGEQNDASMDTVNLLMFAMLRKVFEDQMQELVGYRERGLQYITAVRF